MLNSALVFVRALAAIWRRRPRLVLLGSVERTVSWFIRARRLGLLRGAKLVVTNQLNLSSEQLEQVDRVIVYASAQAAALGSKGVFLPLPADGDFHAAERAAEPGDYLFSGGGAGRDFQTLLESVQGTQLSVELAVFEPEALRPVPPNVALRGPMPLAGVYRASCRPSRGRRAPRWLGVPARPDDGRAGALARKAGRSHSNRVDRRLRDGRRGWAPRRRRRCGRDARCSPASAGGRCVAAPARRGRAVARNGVLLCGAR